MCVSCGCGQGDEQHGDRRHITRQQLDQAALAAHTTREQVVENIARSTGRKQAERSGPAPSFAGERASDEDTSSLARTSGRQPGEYAPPQGQESGTAWQESQQMGRTGHGGVQKP